MDSKRHDQVLNELNQSRQRLVFRQDEVDRLELDVVVGVIGHGTVVSTHNGRLETQGLDINTLKQIRSLCLARLLANCLLDALVDLADVARGQRVSGSDSRLGDNSRSLHVELVRMSEALSWTSQKT